MIEKILPRITIWHHKACLVMTNSDPEGRIFLSHPHTNYGFFFLSSIESVFTFFKKAPRERSGSVVECLTRDRRAVGSSLTGVTALCP